MKAGKATTATGRIGEALALDYLRRKRYTILATNYRKPFGEIDIIARDGTTLVFVEVKSRSSTAFGTPFDAVDGRKQRQLSRVAQEYLQAHDLSDKASRFDVIAVRLERDRRPANIEHLQNAFDFVL